MPNAFRLLVSLTVPLLVGALGGLATAQGVSDWYPSLVKPGFTPPAWVFGPVWTVLYIMIGVALFLIWKDGLASRLERVAVLLFGLQLVLNAAWSPLFFGLRAPGAAFVDIVLLCGAAAAAIVAFLRVSPVAGLLLIPYGLWVAFATVLNLQIWRLNS
jgi:tryptophan-rich sensory protein